ncbi:MAG: tetratricopeptide repeat protein, partial [Planctomycetota bacterium]
MSKRKKISKLKTRRPRRSVPSKPGKHRRIIWIVAFVLLLCTTIAALLVVRYVWQRSQQKPEIPPSLSSRELPIQPLVSPSLSPEQQITLLKSSEMELAEKVVRDFPNSGEAYILMGSLHRRLGSSAKAIEFWEKGLELSPKRADVYHSLGIIAMERGDFEQAISSWQKVLEINPRMPGVHNSIAR